MHKHRKWKERILSMGLAVMMVISMFPARVSAAADVEVHTKDLDFINAVDRIDDTCSNPHWTWNDKKDTLTLNNLDLDIKDTSNAAINLGEDVSVVLKGQNKIKHNQSMLIYFTGAGKITGSGSLIGETSNVGIQTKKDLTLDGVKIDILSLKNAIIVMNANLNIKNSEVKAVCAGTGSARGITTNSGGKITIEESKVYAVGPDVNFGAIVSDSIVAKDTAIFGSEEANASIASLKDAIIDGLGIKVKSTNKVAKTVFFKPQSTIKLGEQQSALTYGIQGSADYTVSTVRFGAEGEPIFNPTVQWKGSDGAFTGQAPEGISTAFSSDLKMLTVTAANTVNAGAYIFKTVSPRETGLTGNYESAEAKFIIDKGENSNKEMAVRILSNTVKDNKTITLPDIPGAEYGQPTVTTSNGLVTGTPVVKDKTLTMKIAAKGDGTFETMTIPVAKAMNYKDFTLTVTVTAKDRDSLVVDGLTAATGLTYSGASQQGYTGTIAVEDNKVPTSELLYTYKSTDGKGYDSSAAPTAAGSYKLTVSIPESNEIYAGSQELDFTIAKKELSITGLTAENRAYDATQDIVLKGGSLEGVIAGENVTVDIPVAGTVVSADIGTGKAVNYGTIALKGTDTANYTFTQPEVKVDITPAIIKVDGDGDVAVTKEYDGTVSAGTLTGKLVFSGVVGKEDVSVLSTAGSYKTGAEDVGTGKDVTLELSLTGSDKANYALKDASYEFKKAGITKVDYKGTQITKNINVLINRTTEGTFEVSAFTFPAGFKDAAISDIKVKSDAHQLISSIDKTGAYSIASVETIDQKASCDVVLKSKNYNDYTAELTFTTVIQAPVTISGVSVADKTYDGNPAVMSGEPSAVLESDSSAVEVKEYTYLYTSKEDGKYESENAPVDTGEYKLTVSVADKDEDYRGKIEIPFTISKSGIIVKADDKTMTKGEALPAYTVSYTGFAKDDNKDNKALKVQAAAACSADGKMHGEYPINFTEEAVLAEEMTGNYFIKEHNAGILTVNKRNTMLQSSDGTVTVRGDIDPKSGFRTDPLGGGSIYDAIVQTMDASQYSVISGYDMSITGGDFAGDMTLTIAIGQKYDGKTVVTKHQTANGGIESLESVCADGKITVSVKELSQFVLFTMNKPVIAPITAIFDKNLRAPDHKDVTVSQTLNGNVLNAIKNGGTVLAAGTDYTVSASDVVIKKEYLAKQPVGTTVLTLEYSEGTSLSLSIAISDSTPPVFSAGNCKYSVTGSNTVKVTGFAKGKSSSKVTIPSTVSSAGKVYKVTAIGDKAFYKNSKITKASIGNNVTKIGKNAFKYCSKLQEVSIGNKVTELGDSAFYDCKSLKKVTIGTGLKKLGSHVFCRDKKLTKLTIKSKKLTKIGKHNLYQCHDLKIKVHSSKVKAYTKIFKKQGQKKNVKVSK